LEIRELEIRIRDQN